MEILPSNFHQHHNFYNILLARQNTYKLDCSARCFRLRISTVALSDLSDLRTNTICEKNKEAIIELFPQLVRFLPLKKYLTLCKSTLQLATDHYARWPLCKIWEHRFSAPDLLSPPHWSNAFTRQKSCCYVRTFSRQCTWSSQSIKIGIDLLIDKSIKIGKSDLIDIDCIDQSVEIDDTLVSFIDLSWFFYRFHRSVSEDISVHVFIQKWKMISCKQ